MSSEGQINLLPLRFRQRIAVHRILAMWGWVAAATAGVCGLQLALTYMHHQDHRQRLASLRERNQAVLEAVEQRSLLSERHQEWVGLRDRVAGLIPSDDLLQTLGAIATATVGPASSGARIQTLRIDLQGASASSAAADGPSASPITHVAFTAIAPDEVSLSDLLSRLRQNERFREVRLRGTAEHRAGGGRQADVEAEVVVQKELPE